MDSVRGIFVGDIGITEKLYNIYLERGTVVESKIVDMINGADFSVGNFEFPLTHKMKPEKIFSRYNFVSKPHYIAAISNLNFSTFSLANNHITDWGLEGIQTTKALLSTITKFEAPGCGINVDEALKPSVFKVKGINFALFSVCDKKVSNAKKNKYGSAPFNLRRIADLISKYKQIVNHIIVFVHWGIEYCSYPSPDQIKKAHKLIDAGATLVVGSHPHILQGIQRYKNGLVAYSLGNFIFDTNLDIKPRYESWELSHYSVILEVVFDRSSIVEYDTIPIYIDNYGITRLADTQISEKVKLHLEKITMGLGNSSLFYLNAFEDIKDREKKAWFEKFKKKPLKTLFTFIKSIRPLHIKIILNKFLIRLAKRFF